MDPGLDLDLQPAGRGSRLASLHAALHVAQDRRHVSFMYSVPNHVPARPALVRETQAWLRGVQFDDVCGFTWGLNIIGNGRAAVDESFDRYFDRVC